MDTNHNTSSQEDEKILYPYDPSHLLPAIFAALVGISLILHTFQNFRYRFWRVTFFMVWGGLVYFVGWTLRCVSSYHTSNLNVYIAQTVFTYAGPPIYSAAAYNLLGRLMNYLPMFASFNPYRVVFVFVYLGILVESLTAAGAGRIATGIEDPDRLRSGGILVSISLVLQAVVESALIVMVAVLHRRVVRNNMLTKNVLTVCITLYGTSTFVILRCIFRAIESFSVHLSDECTGICKTIATNEWYIYALEVAPMIIFTYWINVLHPGRQLPSDTYRYLDFNKVERVGPGWSDKRSRLVTFLDPVNFIGMIDGTSSHEKYWLEPERWPVCEGGSFAEGTATNAGKKPQTPKEASQV